MKHRWTAHSPPVAADSATIAAHGSIRTKVAIVADLTDAELRMVSGGLNPQPLPPCREIHEI
jgi:hypothetical protein